MTSNDMKVYLVFESVEYEGDNFKAAFINELDANKHADSLNTDEKARLSVRYYVEPVDVIMSTSFEEPLPHWAADFANGEFVLGSVLPTRDGRITGNACIYSMSTGYKGKELYHCITDAGNTSRMSLEELNERFYPPKYIAKKSEIVKRLQKLEKEML